MTNLRSAFKTLLLSAVFCSSAAVSYAKPQWKISFPAGDIFYCDSKQKKQAENIYMNIDYDKYAVNMSDFHSAGCHYLYDKNGNLLKMVKLLGGTDPALPEKTLSGKLLIKTVASALTAEEETNRLALENRIDTSHRTGNMAGSDSAVVDLLALYLKEAIQRRDQDDITDEYSVKFDAALSTDVEGATGVDWSSPF